jgi:DNA mismatch endonuclease (patch repair protein)
MADTFNARQRSAIMARVRSRGNASTELNVVAALRTAGITGWRRHLKLAGSPDFVFPKERVAVYVNGCFWHGCWCEAGRLPTSRRDYWEPKIERTRSRDRRNRDSLRRRGYRVIQVWEHELATTRWLRRLVIALG